MNKNKGIAVLILVTIFWSYGFVATQIAIDANLKVPAILCFRFLIGALVIAVVNHKRIKTINKATLIRGSIAGLIMFLAYYTQTLGQGKSTISISALISATYVVFVPILNWIFKGEKPTLYTMLVTILAMSGMIVLNYDGSKLVFGIGEITILISAFAFAMHVSFVDIYCKNDNVLNQSFVQLLSAGILSVIVVLSTDSLPTRSEFISGLPGLLYAAIFASALCNIFQILGQKNVPAANAAIILSMEGVFACIISILLGYESFKINMLIGGVTILLSAILINMQGQFSKFNFSNSRLYRYVNKENKRVKL